jgi:hypothetical protein
MAQPTLLLDTTEMVSGIPDPIEVPVLRNSGTFPILICSLVISVQVSNTFRQLRNARDETTGGDP